MENTFDPGTFRELFESPLGQAVWRFLNEPDNLVRMETATYLGRPAVEPLSPGLLARFGAEVAQDRMKQMIGRMARQIMEPRGYRIDRQNVRITRPDTKTDRKPENMFTSATRYVAHPQHA